MTSLLLHLRSRPKAAITTIRIVAFYILLGAIAKILWGSPMDLPAALTELVRWDEQNLFDTIIFIEISAAVLAFISPRLGWPAISFVLTAFLLILLQQLLTGEATCGCFGSTITVPTPVMFAVDLLALICVLLVQPWESLQTTRWRVWGIAPAPILAALGIWYSHNATILPNQIQLKPNDLISVTQAPDKPRIDPQDIESITDSILPVEPITQEPLTDLKKSDWRLPSRFPRKIKLYPPDWVNKSLGDVALATWVDTSLMPDDCAIIFYYDTCKHCASHINSIADTADEINYVFVQLPTTLNSRHPRIIHSLPKGLHMKLPAGPRWLIETPWEVTAKNGIVVEATPGF